MPQLSFRVQREGYAQQQGFRLRRKLARRVLPDPSVGLAITGIAFQAETSHMLAHVSTILSYALLPASLPLLSSPSLSHPVVTANSTIAPPPEPAIFFNERFLAARHEERCYKNIYIHTRFLVGEGLSNDNVGMASSAVFQEV